MGYPYSVPIEGTKQPGFSHVYRNPKQVGELATTHDPSCSSMKDVIYKTFKNHSGRDFLGKITIKPTTQNGVTVDER